MKTNMWVRHISGQGKKLEVLKLSLGGDNGQEWHVQDPDNLSKSYCLPKSEYDLCDPPEEWEDVTDSCRWEDDSHWEFYMQGPNGERLESEFHTGPLGSYRIRKIDGMHNGPAFIVEMRKS